MLEAGFMEGRQGPFFYLFHPPGKQPARGKILYFHPFAEEMNKSRRMAALQARRFAAEGFAVLQPDHYGCGDSGGDFGDARWETWLDDLGTALDWLGQRSHGPLVLWGLRTGCLLLTDLLRQCQLEPDRILLWQPVVNGEQYMNQFLRLRMAASMMGGEKEGVKALRARLDAGETLEVAGYDLHPELARSLAEARLAAPSRGVVSWFEVGAGEGMEVSPAARQVAEKWTADGITLDTTRVQGEPFWQTQEICELPELIELTIRQCLESRNGAIMASHQ